MQDKKYGYFDDAHREYVITDPRTPSHAIATTVSRWTTADGTSTSKTAKPSGRRDGSRARLRWTVTSAVTA